MLCQRAEPITRRLRQQNRGQLDAIQRWIRLQDAAGTQETKVKARVMCQHWRLAHERGEIWQDISS